MSLVQARQVVRAQSSGWGRRATRRIPSPGILATAALAVGAFLFISLPAAYADEGGARVVRVDSTRSPDVTVTVSVPESVSGTVPPAAFRLSEDGVPHPVRVTQLPNEALRVCLVIDTTAEPSPSNLAQLQSAAAELLIRLPTGAQAAIIGAGNTSLVQPFTDDRAQSMRAVSGLPQGGSRVVHQALSLAATQLVGEAGRPAVVLITSAPDASPAEQDLVQRFGGTDTVWYLVHPVSGDPWPGNPTPAAVVTANGSAITRSNVAGLIGALDAVSSDLLSQYQLNYQSANTGTRQLRVAVLAGALRAEANAPVFAYPLENPVPRAPSERSKSTSSRINLLVWIVLAVLAVIALSALVLLRTRLGAAVHNVAAWRRASAGNDRPDHRRRGQGRATPKRAGWTTDTIADAPTAPASPRPMERTSHTPLDWPASASPTAATPAPPPRQAISHPPQIPTTQMPASWQEPPSTMIRPTTTAESEPTPTPDPAVPNHHQANGAAPLSTDPVAARSEAGIMVSTSEASDTAAVAAAAAATLAAMAAPTAAAVAAAAAAAAAPGRSDANTDDVGTVLSPSPDVTAPFAKDAAPPSLWGARPPGA